MYGISQEPTKALCIYSKAWAHCRLQAMLTSTSLCLTCHTSPAPGCASVHTVGCWVKRRSQSSTAPSVPPEATRGPWWGMGARLCSRLNPACRCACRQCSGISDVPLHSIGCCLANRRTSERHLPSVQLDCLLTAPCSCPSVGENAQTCRQAACCPTAAGPLQRQRHTFSYAQE